MSGVTAGVAPALSALRMVSFVPQSRDAVRVGLLTPDAQSVIDLTPLGIHDALDAVAQLDLLRRTAGAIIHGAARSSFAITSVHLVAAIPLARSVIRQDSGVAPSFADPTTLHGPGGHLSRRDAEGARAGLAAVVGVDLPATASPDRDRIEMALVGSVLVLGWPQEGHVAGHAELRPGAIGPFVAVPRRRPESLIFTQVAPVSHSQTPDHKMVLPAPADHEFLALAELALRSHALRAGDLLTIFPDVPPLASNAAIAGGSWVRVSAPGLGTLSLAVL
jgi:hypothetical protein